MEAYGCQVVPGKINNLMEIILIQYKMFLVCCILSQTFEMHFASLWASRKGFYIPLKMNKHGMYDFPKAAEFSTFIYVFIYFLLF